MMTRLVRSTYLTGIVVLEGLLLTGCSGAESNRTTAPTGLPVSETPTVVSAETAETAVEAHRAEGVPEPAPGTGILATGATGRIAGARRMDLTSYDDGRSCPADCDSHVVFHGVHNGTASAFRPGAGADPFAVRSSPSREQCRNGQPCVICFGPENASCLITTYRGSGPPEGRFDITPAFLKEWCGRAGLPPLLAEKCRSHMRTAERLAAKVNCIANPDDSRCAAVMAEAMASKAEDAPRYERCKQMGEAAYNASLADASLRRQHDCAYFRNRRDPTGRWLLLTPGACRNGYFVGKHGLDCCSADPVQAAIDARECSPYYR